MIITSLLKHLNIKWMCGIFQVKTCAKFWNTFKINTVIFGKWKLVRNSPVVGDATGLPPTTRASKQKCKNEVSSPRHEGRDRSTCMEAEWLGIPEDIEIRTVSKEKRTLLMCQQWHDSAKSQVYMYGLSMHARALVQILMGIGVGRCDELPGNIAPIRCWQCPWLKYFLLMIIHNVVTVIK